MDIGALSWKGETKIVAPFSNYGKNTVDVFAPGSKIWSSVPHGKYDYYSGTSMAAPNATGVAAALRSFFPKLKAHQVKKVLMKIC